MKLRVGEKNIDLSTPVVMTIINVTPDSFFADSRNNSADQIAERVGIALEQGASILDIGGYSSRPFAEEVAPIEELRRVWQAMEVIRKYFPLAAISLDTFRADVAEQIIIEFGECIINDITAGGADPEIFNIAAKFDVPFIAMHMLGTPQTMQQNTTYVNLCDEVYCYFETKMAQLRSKGVNQIILDPGFGFSKTTEQNYTLLKHLHTFNDLECPILAGISRKSMIYKTLNTTPQNALNGTTALNWEALRQGSSILRVHDTAEAMEVIKLYSAFDNASSFSQHANK